MTFFQSLILSEPQFPYQSYEDQGSHRVSMGGHWCTFKSLMGFPGGSVGKNLPAMQEAKARSLAEEDLEKKMATHSNILARKIPWAEETGGLQSMGSQRVRHNLDGLHCLQKSLFGYIF